MHYAHYDWFTVELPDDAVEDCSGTGDATESVEFWKNRIDRPVGCTPESLREHLKEYGAWDDDQLSCDDDNWMRCIWIAACDINEGFFG